MKKSIVKKGLVIAVIVLFISVSFQPVFAVDNKSSTNYTENENECGCVTVSDLQRIRFEELLNRLDIRTKKLSLLFKNNQKILKNYDDLLRIISKNKALNYTPIFLCSFIMLRLAILLECYFIALIIIIIFENAPSIIKLWADSLLNRMGFLLEVYETLGCPYSYQIDLKSIYEERIENRGNIQ